MSASLDAPRGALYVVLSNTSGRQNLGTYLRTASAFGATQVIVVGSQRFGTHGAHRAHKYVDIVHFYNFSDARAYLVEKRCTLVGLQRTHDSQAAHSKPYAGSTAFVIDNEGGALSAEQVAICDSFVHVPFHGPQKEPLTLDATVVTALVLHHFTTWAQFPVRPFEATTTQGKFVLDTFPVSDGSDARSQQIAAARAAKRAYDVDELMHDELGNIFGASDGHTEYE